MTNNKKVLFLINNLGFGGAERVFVSDANSLSNEGFDVYFCILYGGEDKSPMLCDLKIPKEKIIFLKAKNIYDFSSFLSLRKFLINNKDCILYSTLHDAVFVSRFAVLRLPNRLITREANTTENKSILHKIADGLMNFRVNVMLAVSLEVKKSMLIYQPWFKSKINVLYNGVVIPKDFSLIEKKGDTILNVASLTPKKAQLVLIQAFELVLKKIPTAKLKIIGTGVLEKDLKDTVSSKNISDNVFFLGKMNQEMVFEEYKKSDIFVLSSNQEGCPNVLLEAMSFGLPSVSTKVGAVSEIIEDNVSGFIVEKGDYVKMSELLVNLLISNDLRENIGQEARKNISERFSDKIHINKLKSILFK